MGNGTQLDGGRELALLKDSAPLAASLIQRIIDAVNRTGVNAGVSPVGQLPPPPPVDATTVAGSYDATSNTLTAPGEILHAVHTHNTPLQRGIQYVTEIDTDPSFPAPHPINQSTSRSVFASLPSHDSNGQLGYYLRVTPQYHGSAPQKPTVYGGLQGPTKIVMTGSTTMDLIPSQAAGTARPGQGGKGLGPVQARGPVGGPKRVFSNQK